MGGVNYFPKHLKPFQHFLTSNKPYAISGNAISEFCEDEKGNIWIGTEDGGLNYYNIETEKFTNFVPDMLRNSISIHNIHALMIYKENLYIGTYTGGMDIYNLKTKTFRNFKNKKGDSSSLISNSVYDIFKDKSGTIWIGTIHGLCTFDAKKEKFLWISEMDLESTFIYDILQDNEGFIWFASYDEGVYRFNPANNTWKNFRHKETDPSSLAFNKVLTICEDFQSNIWFGTEGGGISRFNRKEDAFTNYDENQNLPNNVVYSIVCDLKGNLWMTTNKGLAKFDPLTENFRVYTNQDGLQSNQFNYKSGMISSSGMLYFGGTSGFNCFHPDSLKENDFIPPTVITNFQINNKDIPIGTEDSPLKQSISYTKEITLSHKQNVFNFEYVALSFAAPTKNLYKYRLDGIDTGWNYVGDRKRISFTGIAPGEYKLHIRGSNNDGVWDNKGTSIKINVLPPLWKTDQAFFFYILFLIILVTALIFYVNKLSNRRHQVGLLALREQKEKEINRLKMDFFTNIAHEIRTPLTLISGPLENLLASWKGEDETLGEFTLMKKNVARLINLVNQLLDFRKVESGKYQLKYSNGDIVELLYGIYSRFTSLAKQKGIDFRFASNVEFYKMTIDAEIITKIISNLLTNAFKHTKNFIKL